MLQPIYYQYLYKTLQSFHTRPALTWYGPQQERVELSGEVLAGHAIKAAGIWETYRVTTGHNVLFDLPIHWRTLSWAIGCWTQGITISLLNKSNHSTCTYQALITDQPHSYLSALPNYLTDYPEIILAIDLHPLAFEFSADLPWGWVDANAEMLSEPDNLSHSISISPQTPALIDNEQVIASYTCTPPTTSTPNRLYSAPIPPKLSFTEHALSLCSDSTNSLTPLTPDPTTNPFTPKPTLTISNNRSKRTVLHTHNLNLHTLITQCAQAWHQKNGIILFAPCYTPNTSSELIAQEIGTRNL